MNKFSTFSRSCCEEESATSATSVFLLRVSGHMLCTISFIRHNLLSFVYGALFVQSGVIKEAIQN